MTTTPNPFAPALAAAAAHVAGSPRRDRTDRVETVIGNAERYVSGQEWNGWSQATLDAFSTPADPTATPKQIYFIGRLFAERTYAGETRPKFKRRLSTLDASPEAVEALTVREASNLIDYLLTLPEIETIEPTEPEAVTTITEPEAIPAGRYAYTGTEGHTVFVKVDTPTEGKWAGRTFVKLQVSGDYRWMDRNAQNAAKAAIRAQGIKESALRYGHELGACGLCGLPLTNAQSRADGIGPKCKTKMGW